MTNNTSHITNPILEIAAANSLLSEQRVLELASHDPNVLFMLWPSYQYDLYHGCLAWMGNQQDAEDSLSEIVLKAWKQLPIHAEKINSLKGWLTRLSYNHCMDSQRRDQRKSNHRVGSEKIFKVDTQIIDNSPLPQEIVLNDEMFGYLYRAIALLPERLRQVIILRFWGDKSYQQIADHFAISPSAVGKRLQEACSLLSRQMTDYLEGYNDPQALDDATLNRKANTMPSVAFFEEAQVLSVGRAEIEDQIGVIYCAIQVTLPSGVMQASLTSELTFILPLRDKPTRVEQRLRSLQRDVQRHPTGWKKRLQLADLCYAIGRWEEAIDGYYQVLKKQPQSLELYLQLGQILYLLEQENEAIEVYEDALSQARQESTRHHLHGLIAFSRRQYSLAATELEVATKLSPENAVHWHLLGQVHLAREAYQAAVQAYDVALDLNPDDLIALSESYEPLLVLGRFDEALQRVRRTLQLEPHDLHAVKRLADHRSRMGLTSGEARKQTKKLIRAACQIAPQSAYAEAARATYHLYRGKWKEGVAVLQAFVEKDSLNSEGWYHYALYLFQSGDFQAASEAILAALALTQSIYPFYRAACEILPYAGRLDELQPLMKKMLERFPERWSAWCSVGRVLVLSGDDRGCTISAQATQLQPRLAEPWLQYGRTLALAGKDHQAIEALSNGCQYIPQEGALLSVRASVWLAESYQKLGDEANCCKWWQEAVHRAKALIQLEPASGTSLPMAYYWQGRALEGLGSFDVAAETYQSALDHHLLYPAREDVLNFFSLKKVARC